MPTMMTTSGIALIIDTENIETTIIVGGASRALYENRPGQPGRICRRESFDADARPDRGSVKLAAGERELPG